MRNAVQALLVALIFLVLATLLGPAILLVRRAADRSQCNNNLKQLGLAIRNYHDTYGKFPRTAALNPDLPPEMRQSWIVDTWPFVEASDLYNRMDHKKAWNAEENRFAALTDLKILQCPGFRGYPPTSTFASTSYVGITGLGANADHLPLEDPRAGFFGYERTIKIEDLHGRAPSIVMLAETMQARGAWTAAGPPTTRGLVPDGSPYFGRNDQFGGTHGHGANVTFADGSVRFIEQSIDPVVWEAMATLGGKGNRE
jgi:prepilin-type processing-associated H-X9-DG protein